MEISRAASPLVVRRRRVGVALASALAASALAAGTAHANAGKVLVFTGSGGAAPISDATNARKTALQAIGAAGDFTVDVTTDPTKIAAANLAGYRAVAFINSSGDVLN